MRTGQELTDWAQTAVAVPLAYARGGSSLAWAALAGARVFEPLVHYPSKDVVDKDRGTRFYYHAHDGERWDEPEHGHFHLFVDGGSRGEHMHLAALSVSAQGLPQRWFATNGWVTGERWRPASEVVGALQNFEVRAHGRMAPVARWLTAMVVLFRSELVQLLQSRDERLACLAGKGSLEQMWADREHDVLAVRPGDLPARLASLGLA